MNITLRIDNNSTYIIGRLSSPIYQDLKKCLGYMPENAIFMIKQVEEKNERDRLSGKDVSWKTEWDGRISSVCYSAANCKCSIKKQGTHFPTGLASRAINLLRSKGVIVTVEDCRQEVDKSLSLSMSEDFETRDYQKEVIDAACNVDRGIIKCATGSGKTSIASAIIANRAVSPMIFYVTSIDLLTQAKSELEKFIKLNGSDLKVGELSGLKKDIQDITVMTVQTAVRSLGGVWVKFDEEDSKKEKEDISKIKKEVRDLIHSSKLMVCDEVQHWAAETCQIISDHSYSARYRYGMSATPFRDKGDDILIDGCFGRVIADINASMLIRLGYLVKPKITFIPIDNSMGSKKLNYANIYKEAIVYNSYRNNIISTLAQNMANDGRIVLILCKQIAHGKLLEKLIPESTFLHGSHSAKKRKKHIDLMRSGEANITIASTILDEGVDCKPLDGLILAGSGKSPTRALQRVGRTLRPYTYPDGRVKQQAMVVDFMDNCKYMRDHSKKRLKMYKSEPEFEVEVM
jgi:superfamily II DNA or RNA helicase